jgi:hypothetical protein
MSLVTKNAILLVDFAIPYFGEDGVETPSGSATGSQGPPLRLSHSRHTGDDFRYGCHWRLLSEGSDGDAPWVRR